MNEQTVILVLKILGGVFGAIIRKNASSSRSTQVNINLAGVASGSTKQTRTSKNKNDGLDL